MNFWTQLVIVVLATAFFAWRYYATRQMQQLIFVIWIPTTLLNWVLPASYLSLLGAIQFIFFGLVIFFIFKKPKEENANQEDSEENNFELEENEEAEAEMTEDDLMTEDELEETEYTDEDVLKEQNKLDEV